MTTAQLNSIGTFLREAREAHGLSRAKLAALTNLNPNSIAKYEKAGIEGGQYPPLEKLVTLCFALRLDPRLIFARATQSREEARFFLNLDEHLAKVNDNMEKMFSAFIATMAMAAKKEMETEEVSSPVTSFLSKTYADMEKELEERGEDFGSLFKQNGPNQIDPSRPEISTTNSEAVSAASTEPKKGKSDDVA